VVVAGRGAGRAVSAGTAPAEGRFRRHAEPQAICPVDDWAFTPRYTEGRCPLCGWEAPGTGELAARTGRDWFWPAIVVLLVVSVVMGILVVLTYLRT